jgi:hypothetical protein
VNIKVDKILFVCVIVLGQGCVEPFDPPVRNEDVGFLVVDGYLNTTDHVATISLSRAVPLSSVNQYPTVTNATVNIEDAEGHIYRLETFRDGLYTLSSPEFITGKEYRLIVRTSNGNEYASAFITTKRGSSIDSLTYDVEDDGINVRVNTHDFEYDTKYYRWDLNETWEYQSAFASNFEFINGRLELRKFNERINICYKTETSPVINTANTLDLERNKITQHPLLFLEQFSPKLEYHYSVEVAQYTLSKEGYDYWEQLRVSTQNLGGLFDPQPARIKGNIVNSTNNNEAVIGFFDGGEINKKRLFIRNRDLPQPFQRYPRDASCEEFMADPLEALRLNGAQLITSAVYEGITLIGYRYTTFECADCRLKGGVLQKPDFWP